MKRTLSAALALTLALIVSGLVSAADLLPTKQMPTETAVQSNLGGEKFNVVRFATYGNNPEYRLVGYYLYPDGVTVTGTGPQVERIGKMTLNEALADRSAEIKAKDYRWASAPIIREVDRGNKVVGYSIGDVQMGIELWDATTDPSNINLKLVYRDLQAKGERYFGGPR